MITYKATQSENIIVKIDSEKNTSTFIPVPTSVGIATTTTSEIEVNGGEYSKYLKWISEGNTIEPYVYPINNSPQWKKFLAEIKKTNTFSLLRIQSRLDLGFNGLSTELRTELGEAALGISSEGTIQPLLDELSVGLTTSQKEELNSLIVEYRIPLTISV